MMTGNLKPKLSLFVFVPSNSSHAGKKHVDAVVTSVVISSGSTALSASSASVVVDLRRFHSLPPFTTTVDPSITQTRRYSDSPDTFGHGKKVCRHEGNTPHILRQPNNSVFHSFVYSPLDVNMATSGANFEVRSF